MKKIYLTGLFLTALLTGVAFSQSKSLSRYLPGTTPVGFESEINEFLRQDSVSFPQPGAYLFTGSSTIRKWKSLETDFKEIRLLQRGFGGSTMAALNYYIRDIVLPYKPDTIVVYEGDNDLANGTGTGLFVAQCDTFIRAVHRRSPGTMIYFLSVKPSFARKQLLTIQQEVNRKLKELTQKRSKTGFIDITRLMHDKQGNLRKDLFEADSLHVNAECYHIWARHMKAVMGIPVPGAKR
jgi:lysophospholipase L1-like esterase